MLVLDGGDGLFERTFIKQAERGGARARAELICRTLARMKIDAFVPGPRDLALGVSELRSLARRHRLPLVAANVVRAADGAPAFRTHITRTFGTSRVVVIGLVDPTTWPPGTGLRVRPAQAVVGDLIGRVARAHDIVVLLARTDSDTAVELARLHPYVRAVAAADATSLSFYPREVTDKGRVAAADGAAVPVFSAGHSGQQIAQLGVHVVAGDAVLRGGVVFEEAREQRREARQQLARLPGGAAAQRSLAEAEAVLARQHGKTFYTYALVELVASLADDPVVAQWRHEAGP